jgi:hypothetical protein
VISQEHEAVSVGLHISDESKREGSQDDRATDEVI